MIPSAENMAVYKYPKNGKCKNTCFANGNHRVGMIPVMSVLDGATPGDILQEICLQCWDVFNKTAFIIKNQPNSIKHPELLEPKGK